MRTPERARTALTRRGGWLLACGAVLLVVGALLGEQPFVQLGVFVLVLPLVSAAVVARERFRPTVTRTAAPARVRRGEPTEVTLELTSAGRRPGATWLLTEQLPAALGPEPSFAVPGVGSGRTAALSYPLAPRRRGRYALGPLRARVVDPFGLVERSTAGTATAPLLVLPRVQPLGTEGPVDGHGGEGSRRSIAVHGEDDVSIREYRRGDDLRKVHWRATARTGELQVRLEERPWRARTTVLLDTRRPAHLVAPQHDPDPADSLEWAVEAAASIAVGLGRRGSEVRVVTEQGELTGAGRAPAGTAPEALLDRLAALTPSSRTELAPGIEVLRRIAGDGQVVCLLGALGPDDVAELVRVRPGPSAGLAVLLDLGSFLTGVRGTRAGTSAASSTLADAREETAAVLRAAGWRVAVARAGDPVERPWAALAARPAAGALR
ncbi:DUF58 domain-containing protein [Blastococcus sp. SYSU D01042]